VTLLMDHVILLMTGAVLSYPLIRRPLSEDDGNWFYLAFFQDRGVRLYRDFHTTYGYFGIFGMAAVFFRIFHGRTPAFFQYFKAIWYCLNALALYWLTLIWTDTHGVALIASLLLMLVGAVPNTLFFLTYAEHFLILPFCLSLLCMSLGLEGGAYGWVLASGVFTGWAVQIKPTALIFGAALACACLKSPNPWTDTSIYLLGALVINLLPCFFLSYDRGACIKYLLSTFGGAFGLITILLERVSGKLAHRLTPEIFRSGQGFTYLRGHHQATLREQAAAFRRFMSPSLRDLRGVLVLACVQVIGVLRGPFDAPLMGIVILGLVCLLMQQIQKNYYTPHFNLVWLPVCFLAAKTVWEVVPALFSGGSVGWVATVLLLPEAARMVRSIHQSFLRQGIESVGYLGPALGALFRLSESVGHYIREHSRPNEKLLVWGDQPSIYLYAEREAFHPDYLFLYTHTRLIHDEKELSRFLHIFRNAPPELLLFYQYKYPDGWNMERLEEAAGIPYRWVTSFQLKDSQGRVMRLDGGVDMDFRLYRRADDRYRDVLMERAAFALSSSDSDRYRWHLKKILDLYPEDQEAAIRMEALAGHEASRAGLRVYVEDQLKGEETPKSSLLARMLGDLDKQDGRMEQAAAHYQRAMKVLPPDFRILNGLAEIAFSQGDVEGARKFVERSYQLNPYSAETHNNLGVLSTLTGDTGKAKGFFQRALKAIPGYEDAMANLEQVYHTEFDKRGNC
jgi:tetratricopeptide (TPR) repeat protein